ncbi:MAG: hypothetical protein SPI70_05795, partial [Oscillospiraceae bacterium]|nr:hypothetical protein [Oscillospiraceae bacterium]
ACKAEFVTVHALHCLRRPFCPAAFLLLMFKTIKLYIAKVKRFFLQFSPVFVISTCAYSTNWHLFSAFAVPGEKISLTSVSDIFAMQKHSKKTRCAIFSPLRGNRK